MRVSIPFVIVVGSIVSMTGCATALDRTKAPKDHILQFDRQGEPLDPTKKNLKPLDACEKKLGCPPLAPSRDGYDRYLDDLFASLRKRQPNNRRVLIFIHGGLNSTDDTIRRAIDYTPILQSAIEPEAPGEPSYFPIFVNWDSGLRRSYATHLVHLRQGGYGNSWYLSPFIFLADVLRAVGRAPATWFQMFKSEFEGKVVGRSDVQKGAQEIYCKYRGDYEHDYEHNSNTTAAVSKGENNLDKRDRVHSAETFIPLIPAKMGSALVIDATGTESWNVMLRNVELLFRKDNTCTAKCLALPSESESELKSQGGLALFLERMHQEIEESGVSWDITLIAHSAGAIVANRILRTQKIHFTKIVYMAAACSVDDYEMSVFPYLNENSDTHMYHLVLHDVAEVRDTSATLLGPRGSLLVWIDNFLSSPLTLRQRTAGRFVNLFRALPDTPAKLLPQISIRTFASFGFENPKKGSEPQRHGDFAKPGLKSGETAFPFYKKEFWTPAPGDQQHHDKCCDKGADPVKCGVSREPTQELQR